MYSQIITLACLSQIKSRVLEICTGLASSTGKLHAARSKLITTHAKKGGNTFDRIALALAH